MLPDVTQDSITFFLFLLYFLYIFVYIFLISFWPFPFLAINDLCDKVISIHVDTSKFTNEAYFLQSLVDFFLRPPLGVMIYQFIVTTGSVLISRPNCCP